LAVGQCHPGSYQSLQTQKTEAVQQAYQTTGKNLSCGELSQQLTALKRQEAWLYDFDSPMLQQALANLKRAFDNFFAKRARYPKFKKKKSSGQSFRYRRQEEKLRRAQRHWSRCQKGSRNPSQARLRVAKVHERTANLRKEFLHQLSQSLVQQWDVQDLHLKSLAKIKHAKSWFDASFGEFLRQVEYKTLWNNKRMVWVDTFSPSPKPCSQCGSKNDDLGLADRQWKCPACETQHSRDWNAAQNGRDEVMRMLAVGYTESRNACGRDVSLANASRLDGSKNPPPLGVGRVNPAKLAPPPP